MRRKPPAVRLYLQPEGRSHDLGRTILILSANSFDIPVRVGNSGRLRGASKPHRAGTCCRSASGDPGSPSICLCPYQNLFLATHTILA